jgi:hypothetical protein
MSIENGREWKVAWDKVPARKEASSQVPVDFVEER